MVIRCKNSLNRVLESLIGNFLIPIEIVDFYTVCIRKV